MTFPKSDSTVLRLGLLLYATILLSLKVCKAEKITVYEDEHFKGAWFRVTLTGSACYNLPQEWNDRISSVHTLNNCIMAWEHAECTGRSERIAPGTPSHEDLAAFDFDERITSINLCPGKDDERESPQPSPPNNELWELAASEHNKYRRRHGVPDIRVDNTEIHNTAQKYAEYLARNDMFEPSWNLDYGENLARNKGANKKEAIRRAVRRWYSEESEYNYDTPGFHHETSSFTALVWKSTTHVGVGVAWNPERRQWIVVANYNPEGNIRGRFTPNVPPPSVRVHKIA